MIRLIARLQHDYGGTERRLFRWMMETLRSPIGIVGQCGDNGVVLQRIDEALARVPRIGVSLCHALQLRN